MLVNADFSRRVIVTPEQYEWITSPQRGVERMMLERIGAEQARATSVVRYAADSHFPGHAHPGGEEILVLSGTFSENDVHYQAGWYLRNPPGSVHRPSSAEGALIFVKLRQMQPGDTQRVRLDTRDPARWQREDGREVCPLFSYGSERVFLRRLSAGEVLFDGPVEGIELFVLSGDIVLGEQPCRRGSWIRLPKGAYPGFIAGARGATCYFKTGHLADPAVEACA
ncbi:cupin domain-containing protein [Burkholderia sp. Bp9004]|uniref:cupin domain-containing protein n=1 Tax=Burkholderia sp. Bp9004 TaxID=2184559 RepID=UPI000F5FEA44|nr:cupin domain-containing protein [Burkholderia sp. Bp9004]RQZ62280.1 anti-sigma factor [Burkholderia sp. Bp9004]